MRLQRHELAAILIQALGLAVGVGSVKVRRWTPDLGGTRRKSDGQGGGRNRGQDRGFTGSSAFSFQGAEQGLAAWVVPELVERPQNEARREHLGQHQGGLSGKGEETEKEHGPAQLA